MDINLIKTEPDCTGENVSSELYNSYSHQSENEIFIKEEKEEETAFVKAETIAEEKDFVKEELDHSSFEADVEFTEQKSSSKWREDNATETTYRSRSSEQDSTSAAGTSKSFPFTTSFFCPSKRKANSSYFAESDEDSSDEGSEIHITQNHNTITNELQEQGMVPEILYKRKQRTWIFPEGSDEELGLPSDDLEALSDTTDSSNSEDESNHPTSMNGAAALALNDGKQKHSTKSKGDSSSQSKLADSSVSSDDGRQIPSSTRRVTLPHPEDISSLSNVWHMVDGKYLKNIRFTSVASNSVINVLQSASVAPIDIFNFMVTEDIYGLIAHQTNINARKVRPTSRMKEWKDTNVAEVKKFLSIVMYMGVVSYPRITLYWSKRRPYKNDFVPSIMPRNRFLLLLRFLHFADNNHAPPNDRLFKIRNLLSLLERNFSNAKNPGELIAVDETMVSWHGCPMIAVDESIVSWRGRLLFRQYDPGKAHKYGVKLYKLCDPQGYTYTSSVYCGKFNAEDRGNPTESSTQRVLDLSERYLETGRTIVTDNLCTSVSLARALLERGTHLLGTLRNNCKETPKEAIIDAKVRRGEIVGRVSNDGIVVAKWKDKEELIMLSTNHDLKMAPTGKKNRNGEDRTKPEMIILYNFARQGIDISDQMASSCFSPLGSTVRWYHKIAFEFLLNTAVVNALIMYKELTNRDMQIDEFRLAIIGSLCHVEDIKEQSPNAGKHSLEEYATRDSRNRKIRRRCTECYSELVKTVGRIEALKKCKKVCTYCNICVDKPAMCLDCFRKSH